MLEMKGHNIEKITASDPSRKLSKLHIGVSGRSDIVIDLPQGDYAGASETIEF